MTSIRSRAVQVNRSIHTILTIREPTKAHDSTGCLMNQPVSSGTSISSNPDFIAFTD